MVRFSFFIFFAIAIAFVQDSFALQAHNSTKKDVKISISHPSCSGGLCKDLNLGAGQGHVSSEDFKKGAKIKVKSKDGKKSSECAVPNKNLKQGEYFHLNVRDSRLKFFGIDKLRCEVQLRNPNMDMKDMEKFVKANKK